MKKPPFVQLGIGFLKTIPETPARQFINLANRARLKHVYRLKIPRSLIFFVTNRCNAACRHCFYWKEISNETNELTIEEIRKLSNNLKGLKEINITGGEPFLRDDLDEICRLFVGSGVKTINIPTNGIMIERITDFAKKMVKTPGLSTLKINVSLDGPKERHNSIRNVNRCYEKATQTIDNLKKIIRDNSKFNLSISTTVSHDNLPDMKEFIQELCRMDIPLMISPVRGTHNNTFGISEEVRSDFNPQKAEVLDSITDLEKLKVFLASYANKHGFENWSKFQQVKLDLVLDTIKYKKKMVNCLAGYADGVIFNNGDVALCESTKPIGNLRNVDMDFKKLWWSQSACEMRERIKNCFCIHPCNVGTNMKYDVNSLNKIIRN